jgi:hypothetical protein
MSRTPDPQFRFADLELSRLARPLDARLPGIDSLLDKHVLWSSKLAWIWSAA